MSLKRSCRIFSVPETYTKAAILNERVYLKAPGLLFLTGEWS